MTISEALVNNYHDGHNFISSDQVGLEIAQEWAQAIKSIFDLCIAIRKSDKWKTSSDISAFSERNEIYQLSKKLIDMIGCVNGQKLRLNNDTIFLLISYSSARPAPKELSIEQCRKPKKCFRLRLERYFARQIIIQSLKTQEMLDDDDFDFRIVRRLKTSRKKGIAASSEANSDDGVDSDESKTVGFTNFVVRSNVFACNKNHHLVSLTAWIDIITPSGNVIRKSTPAGYCEECDTFFILERDFERLKVYGILLCQIIDKQSYECGDYILLNGSGLKPESLLHRCGYNVNASSNLTVNQRHGILERVVVHGLYTKVGLLSFLDWLIVRSKNLPNSHLQNAIVKWQNDRDFVATLNLGKDPSIHIDRITKHISN